jgi:hypothetical protein
LKNPAGLKVTKVTPMPEEIDGDVLKKELKKELANGK